MQIPILGSGIKGRSANVTAQNRLNVYLDIQKSPDKTAIAAYGTPGLSTLVDFGAEPSRGIWWMQSLDILFVVNRATLWTVNAAGTMTAVGTLATNSGRVSMADNGTQLIIVDGVNGYVYTPNTSSFSQIVAPGWPGGDTVVFLDSYFIVNKPGTGQFYISGQYDGTTWNALDFATAESNPDNLVRVATERGQVALFGEISSELWGDSGALDFPFARISAAALEYGLAARWSLARCNDLLTGLLKNRRGQLFVGALNGYEAAHISTPELDYLINGYTAPSSATAFSYYMNGHEFYQINFTEASWLYDATSGIWSQVQGYEIDRHRAELSAVYRNDVLVTDYANGKLYKLLPDAYSDDGSPLVREFTTGHGFDQTDLNQMIVNRFRLDMEGGVGLKEYTQGDTPQVMLQISRDGGHTWGRELWRMLGKIGAYTHRVEWYRLGIARDFVFKVRMTDPVKFAAIAGYVEIQVANK